MTPLIILPASFAVVSAINKYFLKEKLPVSLFGRFAITLVLLADGIAHFTNTGLMVQMMPGFMPAKNSSILPEVANFSRQ